MRPHPEGEGGGEGSSRTNLAALAQTIAAQVPDPEIPVVSIAELGILRSVEPAPEGSGVQVIVTITPTYSGCPAMGQIHDDILAALADQGITAEVRSVLAPAWTTDWISAEARAKLKSFGIAPPTRCSNASQNTAPIATYFAAKHDVNTMGEGRFLSKFGISNLLEPPKPVPCPRCDSIDTVEVSHFGSTACKAQLRCLHCKEPFDYFKPY